MCTEVKFNCLKKAAPSAVLIYTFLSATSVKSVCNLSGNRMSDLAKPPIQESAIAEP